MKTSREDGVSTAVPPRPTPEGNEVARHIARVAARLFAERGYEATSVRAIVEAAGVAKPTLYYYFGSKERLAKTLISVPLDALVERLRRAVEEEPEPLRSLERVLEAHFDFCREDPDRMRFLHALIFGPPGSEMGSHMKRCASKLVGWTKAAITRCAEAGIIAEDQVDACATVCRGVIVVSSIDYLYGGKPLEADRARRLVADLLRGFDARRGPGGPETRL